jgi:hypothetical protein
VANASRSLSWPEEHRCLCCAQRRVSVASRSISLLECGRGDSDCHRAFLSTPMRACTTPKLNCLQSQHPTTPCVSPRRAHTPIALCRLLPHVTTFITPRIVVSVRDRGASVHHGKQQGGCLRRVGSGCSPPSPAGGGPLPASTERGGKGSSGGGVGPASDPSTGRVAARCSCLGPCRRRPRCCCGHNTLCVCETSATMELPPRHQRHARALVGGKGGAAVHGVRNLCAPIISAGGLIDSTPAAVAHRWHRARWW